MNSEEGPLTINGCLSKGRLSRGKALEQKRHSFRGVMKHALNCEAKDMMKRLSQPVQGFKPHSQMLTSLVCSEKKQRTTEGGLSLTYNF